MTSKSSLGWAETSACRLQVKNVFSLRQKSVAILAKFEKFLLAKLIFVKLRSHVTAERFHILCVCVFACVRVSVY